MRVLLQIALPHCHRLTASTHLRTRPSVPWRRYRAVLDT